LLVPRETDTLKKLPTTYPALHLTDGASHSSPHAKTLRKKNGLLGMTDALNYLLNNLCMELAALC
jgi:hypothetical protein